MKKLQDETGLSNKEMQEVFKNAIDIKSNGHGKKKKKVSHIVFRW